MELLAKGGFSGTGFNSLLDGPWWVIALVIGASLLYGIYSVNRRKK